MPKGKRNKAVCPDYQIMNGGRVKVGEIRTFVRERRIRARAWREKGGLHGEGRQIPRRKGGQAGRASLGVVEGSMSG